MDDVLEWRVKSLTECVDKWFTCNSFVGGCDLDWLINIYNFSCRHRFFDYLPLGKLHLRVEAGGCLKRTCLSRFYLPQLSLVLPRVTARTLLVKIDGSNTRMPIRPAVWHNVTNVNVLHEKEQFWLSHRAEALRVVPITWWGQLNLSTRVLICIPYSILSTVSDQTMTFTITYMLYACFTSEPEKKKKRRVRSYWIH